MIPSLLYDRMPLRIRDMFLDAAGAVREDYGYGCYIGNHKQYPYIPLGIESFEESVSELLKDNMRVIDVGCGGGD